MQSQLRLLPFHLWPLCQSRCRHLWPLRLQHRRPRRHLCPGPLCSSRELLRGPHLTILDGRFVLSGSPWAKTRSPRQTLGDLSACLTWHIAWFRMLPGNLPFRLHLA